MKRIFKTLVVVIVLLAGIYAATPLWLPHVIASRMPDGWRLETLRSAYPGLSGIRLKSLSADGEYGPANLKVSATDLYFAYRSLATDIDELTVDVFVRPGPSQADAPVQGDGYSIPVLRLDADLPHLSVRRADVALHLQRDTLNTGSPGPRALKLDLTDLQLTPRANGAYQLGGQLSFEDSLRFTGRLNAEVAPGLIDASLRFPAGEASPWLSARFEQETQRAATTTRFEAEVDAEAANRDWLDSVLARSTRRTVAQVGGRLNLDAEFAGADRQSIETLTLTGEKLLLQSDTATLKIDASLSAAREDDRIELSLPAPALFDYQGDAGWIDQLLGEATPGLQVPHAPQARITGTLGRGAKAVLSTTGGHAARFEGDVDLELESKPAQITLRSNGLQVEMTDIRQPDSAHTEGKAVVTWRMDAPVTYALQDMNLSAGQWEISAEVVSRGGKLSSTGSGIFKQPGSTGPAVTAEEMDLTWKDLDLDTLTGNVDVRTRGFSATVDNHPWTGFEPDLSLALLKNNGVRGAGKLVFAGGSMLPLEFSGNTQSMRWDIHLAPATVRFAKLRSLLSVAGVKLPAEIRMTDGELDLQGDIQVSGGLTATMRIGGHDLIASLHNNRVIGGGFSFDAGYDRTPRANGPLTIETLQLAGDIDLDNFEAELALQDVNRFELRNLHADVFDGQIGLDSLQYSEDGIADTTVRLSHVDLGKLLAYADVDGLQGSGVLDITLPIGSDNTGLHVTNGTFLSGSAGRLAYTREGVAGSNIGLKALENFHYKSLSGTIDYQSDGAYVIGVRLEGNNPDLYEGHPVVFNLNINGSLPALFEALFMTGSFEESILKEIRSRKQ